MDGTSETDMMALPLDRFLNRVLQWLRARMTDKDWRSFESRLHRPPPGVDPASGPWSDAEMAAAFNAFSSEFSKGGD